MYQGIERRKSIQTLYKSGDWVLQFTSAKLRKLDADGEWGDKYTGVCDYTFVNGELHVEGLVIKDEMTRTDHRTLFKLSKALGFKGYKKQSGREVKLK